MKQFPVILSFELKTFFKNKAFLTTTILLVVVIAAVMFFPRIRALISGGNGAGVEESDVAQGILYEDTGDLADAEDARDVMLVTAQDEDVARTSGTVLAQIFPDYRVTYVTYDVDMIRSRITAQDADCAFVFSSLAEYVYYVGNLSMYDTRTAQADAALVSLSQMQRLTDAGLSPEEVTGVLSAAISHKTEVLGQDQAQSYFYTYFMVMALYMVILIYGQMVATSVASEKSSRAMELLITSAKPVAMMFAKVTASCIAGLTQLLLVFGGALLFYQINAPYWGDNRIIGMFFHIPPRLLWFMLLFFLLGFLLYAMMFGAIGSTVSKVEDVSVSITPVMFCFLPGFFVAIFAMISGMTESLLVRVFSFIPFFSPMVMFTRITMSTVPAWEIIVSVAILIVSVVLIGILSAKIYRVGVLLYGSRPKLMQLIKTVAKA